MDKTLKDMASDNTLEKNIKAVEGLAEAFAGIQRATNVFAGPRDDYQGKRLPAKDWKKRQARRRMQKRSRKAARP